MQLPGLHEAHQLARRLVGGGAAEDARRGEGCRLSDGHVRLVQVGQHVVRREGQQLVGAKVEAAERLQRQPRQRRTVQLACTVCLSLISFDLSALMHAEAIARLVTMQCVT